MVQIPMWGYYDGLTAAQTELICTDKPIISYPRRNDNVAKKGRGKSEETKIKHPSTHQFARSAEKWYARHKGGDNNYTTLDLSGYTTER